MLRKYHFLLIVLLVGIDQYVIAQKMGVFNEKQKKIYSIREGKNLDFRIDYNKVFPDKKDEFVEVRVFGVIDTIRGEEIQLVENQIVLTYTKTDFVLVEEEYEFTDLVINRSDIKSMSFTPTMASIGNAMLTIGIAALLVSPLLGITPSGYSTDRFATVAAMGVATAAIGGVFTLSFSQKPVKFKEFDGPEYFRKYQKGSLSVIE